MTRLLSNQTARSERNKKSRKLMKNNSLTTLLTLVVCCVLTISCSRNTSSNTKHSDTINENFSYQLTKYKFGTLNKYIAENRNLINTKNLMDFYYEKMKMSYAAYTMAALLQRYEYAKNFGEGKSGSIQSDELGSTLLIFLLSSYLDAGDTLSFITALKKYPISRKNPLYYRYQVMNAITTGNTQAPILQDYPWVAYRFNANEDLSSGFVLENPPTDGRTLDDLDRMLATYKLGREDVLDAVFHYGAQIPLFSYQYYSPKGQSVDIYDIQSLWLSYMYYGDKLLALSERAEDVSSAYRNYLSAMTYFFRGDKEKVQIKLKNILNSGQPLPATLTDVSHALYLGIVEHNSPMTTERILELKTNLEKVKYCESFFRFSNSPTYEVIDRTFHDILTRNYTLMNSLEGKHYLLTESDNLCVDLEILYTIGRYYLMTNRINEAEKCFLSIYQVYKSFSIKDNINCGNLYEYDPALFVIYSSYAMLNNKNLIPIVLQEITALSMQEKIFFLPSRILSNILTPPKIYGDYKFE